MLRCISHIMYIIYINTELCVMIEKTVKSNKTTLNLAFMLSIYSNCQKLEVSFWVAASCNKIFFQQILMNYLSGQFHFRHLQCQNLILKIEYGY